MADETNKPAENDQPEIAGGDVSDSVAAADTALDDVSQAADQVQQEVGSAEGSNLDLPNFQQVLEDIEQTGIDMLNDVELDVKIELGRTDMLVEDVLRLSAGSVVELDKLAGDPVDIYVNDRLVAKGEVLVLNENFCVRINEIIPGMEDELKNAEQNEEVVVSAGDKSI